MLRVGAENQRTKYGLTYQSHSKSYNVIVMSILMHTSLHIDNSISNEICFVFDSIPALALSTAKFEKVHLAK